MPTKDGELQVPVEGDLALLEGQKKLPGAYEGRCAADEVAWLCLKDKKLPDANECGALQVPGKGSMALLEGHKNYLMPAKYSAPQVPGEGSMAGECQ